MAVPSVQYKNIPEIAMEYFQRILDGHPDGATFAFFLEYLTFHMPDAKLIPALEWLLKNELTGQRFLVFAIVDCKGSGLEMIRYLTMRLEREKKIRRLHVTDVKV